MSPRFLEKNGYIYKIYSREESRMHIHIIHNNKKAKCWLEPKVEIAENNGFKEHQIKEILQIVKENEQEFKEKWKAHLG
ncbi:MAG: DUF4160 domain-containing protein [Chitinophagaceae bacterium]|nr:DUF4160 domain-containing protein [Chitinophagaceae bacterium]